MKKFEYALILSIILILSSLAYAFYAYESVTVSHASKNLTVATYSYAHKALISCETNAIRFTLDGTNIPTSAGVGHRLEVGQILNLNNTNELRNFRAVRASAVDAVLKVTYFTD